MYIPHELDEYSLQGSVVKYGDITTLGGLLNCSMHEEKKCLRSGKQPATRPEASLWPAWLVWAAGTVCRIWGQYHGHICALNCDMYDGMK